MGNPAPRYDNYAAALVTEASTTFKELLVDRRVPDDVIAVLIAGLPAIASQLAQLDRNDLETSLFVLLDACRARVARAVAGLARPASGDEDFVQMAFIKIIEILRKGQDVPNPRGLLHKTAFRKGLDEVRQVSHRKTVSASNLPESASSVLDPEQCVWSNEVLQKGNQILSQYPNWSEVARLTALGLSNWEIALRMNRPLRTITYWQYQISEMWENLLD